MKNLLLLDGSAIFYRSYFAFINNPLKTKNGFNTSAIYGTVNTFIRLIEKFKPDSVIIAFDRKEKTFRHDLDENYKANRPPMPDELVSQIQPVHSFFETINIQVVTKAGFEADDIIASLAYKFKNTHKVTMITGDKDYIQLITDNVLLYDPFKNNFIDEEYVNNKYDIKISQFIDFLALMGDSADNIPGVKGVGAKTAAKLLNQFKNLDGIYKNIDEVKGAINKKLNLDKENAYLSKQLATIVTDMDYSSFDLKEFDKSSLAKSYEFLKEYELNRLAATVAKYDEIDLFASEDSKSQKQEIIEETKAEFGFKAICIDTEDKLKQLVTDIKKAKVIALDTETTGLEPITAELVGVSVCFDSKNAYYIPLGHEMYDNLNTEMVLQALQKAIAGKKVCGHNLKYDLRVLQKYDFDLGNNLADTMIASYLLDSGSMRHSLANCSLKEFEYEMMPISDLIGKGKKQISFALTAVDDATKYAAEDAYVSYMLWQNYEQKLKNLNVEELFYKLEMPLMKVLAKMEDEGVYLDTDFLNNLSKEIDIKLACLTKNIFEQSQKQFNINSTQQLAEVLFTDLKLNPVKKTKTGFSTDSAVLEQLKNEHAIIPLILEYRFLNKLNSTYVSALPGLVLAKTNRVHSSFNQTVASTGRLSSSNPNMQNIPIRSQLGRQIRKAFIAQKQGWCILAADYSQIELRLLAAFSKDPVLIDAFKHEKDIHSQTASVIFGIKPEDVTKDQRAKAKTINFGIIYGMGAVKLSKELGISRTEASNFIKHYFDNFPSIKNYMQKMKDEAKQNGYCQTILGRRLYLPNINSSNKRLSSESERVAVNMPIQGSAADVIKKAMLLLSEFIKNRDDIKMLIQVHDELVFEVKQEKAEELKQKICELMEQGLPKEFLEFVKLKVDANIGDNWLEAH